MSRINPSVAPCVYQLKLGADVIAEAAGDDFDLRLIQFSQNYSCASLAGANQYDSARTWVEWMHDTNQTTAQTLGLSFEEDSYSNCTRYKGRFRHEESGEESLTYEVTKSLYKLNEASYKQLSEAAKKQNRPTPKMAYIQVKKT